MPKKTIDQMTAQEIMKNIDAAAIAAYQEVVMDAKKNGYKLVVETEEERQL